jgi:hypothetical protein
MKDYSYRHKFLNKIWWDVCGGTKNNKILILNLKKKKNSMV